MLRYPVEGPHPDRSLERETLDAMNPFVLTDLVYRTLVVEVDAVEGYEPDPDALEALRATIREHADPGRAFVVVRDDTIPKAEYDAAKGNVRELVERHLDRVPDLERSEEVVSVLYVPDAGGGVFGYHTTWMFERDGQRVVVDGVVIGTDAIREHARLWIGPRKIERATLIHEFGHVLGLVGVSSHEQRRDPLHCSNPQCVMNHPRWRPILYNLPRALFTGRLPYAYCRDCRADIERAKRAWHEREKRDPYFADRLADERRVQALLAEASLRAGEDRYGARLLYLEAMGLDPLKPELLEEVGLGLAKVGDRISAERAFRRVIPRYPSGMAKLYLAQLLAAKGAYDEARSVLDEEYVEASLEDPLRRWGWGAVAESASLALARGDVDGAIAAWNSFGARRWPERADLARLLQASIARRFRRLDRAARLLREVGEETRKGAWFRLESADLEAARGNRAAARSAYESVVGEEENPWNNTARALASLGRLREADAALATAAEGIDLPTWAVLEGVELAKRAGDEAAALDRLKKFVERPDAPLWGDPCTSEATDGLRGTAGFRELVPTCPEGSGLTD